MIAEEEFMCKELTVSRNGQPIHCIAFVKFAPASTGDDIKDGHLALELIVGTGDVYQGEGLDMTRSSDDPRRMHRALEALTDKFPSTSEVDMSLDAGAGGQARLTMRFNIGGIDLPVTIALHPCPDARARILTAMQGLCLTMDALRQSVSNLKEHARSLEVEAKDAEALVAAYVSTAEEAEHNLHESTAELLNKGITNGGAVAQQDSFNPDYVVGMVVEGEEGPSLGTTPGSPSGESSDSDGSLGRPDY